MSPITQRIPAPVVTLSKYGIPTTTSQAVADFFGKRHNDVLRAIDNLAAACPEEYRQRTFAQTVQTRDNPAGGAPLESRAYTLTRDGFTLLAMGFTGARALEWKIRYIEAFNAMERSLQEGTALKALAHSRWLLRFDHDGQASMSALEMDAAVVNASNPKAVAEFIRTCVDQEAIPAAIEVLVKKMTYAIQYQRHHKRSAPTTS